MKPLVRIAFLVVAVILLYLTGVVVQSWIDEAAEERRLELLRSELLEDGTCQPFTGAVLCLGETESGPVIVEHDADGRIINIVPVKP